MEKTLLRPPGSAARCGRGPGAARSGRSSLPRHLGNARSPRCRHAQERTGTWRACSCIREGRGPSSAIRLPAASCRMRLSALRHTVRATCAHAAEGGRREGGSPEAAGACPPGLDRPPPAPRYRPCPPPEHADGGGAGAGGEQGADMEELPCISLISCRSSRLSAGRVAASAPSTEVSSSTSPHASTRGWALRYPLTAQKTRHSSVAASDVRVHSGTSGRPS